MPSLFSQYLGNAASDKQSGVFNISGGCEAKQQSKLTFIQHTFKIPIWESRNWQNASFGEEFMTVVATDDEGHMIDQLCQNYPIRRDISYIFDHQGGIQIQKYGAGHFIDEHSGDWKIIEIIKI